MTSDETFYFLTHELDFSPQQAADLMGEASAKGFTPFTPMGASLRVCVAKVPNTGGERGGLFQVTVR